MRKNTIFENVRKRSMQACPIFFSEMHINFDLLLFKQSYLGAERLYPITHCYEPVGSWPKHVE